MGRLLPPVRRRQHAAGSRVALIVGFEIGRTVEIGIDWRTGGKGPPAPSGIAAPKTALFVCPPCGVICSLSARGLIEAS